MRCAYCPNEATTFDHVVPKQLYARSRRTGSQLITVPCCQSCNTSWQDDEVHFRNVLAVAGDTTPAVRELWEGKILRSFAQPDGLRRRKDILEQVVPAPEIGRPMIFPAKDPRVLRVVRKVVRGLCHHHGLGSPVPDDHVWADIQRYVIPDYLEHELTSAHAVSDVLKYRFARTDYQPEIHSGWELTFFEKRTFFVIVFNSAADNPEVDREAPAA